MKPILKPIHTAFHETNSRSYQWVTTFVWLAIILSIILFLVDISLGENHEFSPGLELADQLLLLIFALEYMLRVISYHPKAVDVLDLGPVNSLKTHALARLRFAIQPLNIVDFITILGGAPALRGLRALRLLRLFRLVKNTAFFRYSNPFYGIIDAYEKNELLYLFGFFIILISTLLGGLSIYLVEHNINDSINSISDALWWALVTLTTVGYGDISPITNVGRSVGGALMIAGMFNLALFAGIVSQTLLSSVLSLREEQFRMSSTMKHIVICGYEPSSRMLLDSLMERFDIEKYKAVIFAPYERPADIPLEFEWINGDPTKESELEKARLAYADSCLILAEKGVAPQTSDARSILTLFTIRSFLKSSKVTEKRKLPLYISVEILDSENATHARTAGADEVIESQRLSYSLLSHSIAEKGTGGVVSSIISAQAHNIYVSTPQEVHALEFPMSFLEASQMMTVRFDVLTIGVQSKDGRETKLNPPPHFMVTEEHNLIYLSTSAIEKSKWL